MIHTNRSSLKMFSLSRTTLMDRKCRVVTCTNEQFSLGIGMALLSVAPKHIKRYRDGPQRMFEKVFAFNHSWIQKNIQANSLPFQGRQDILDLLMVRLKVYEQYGHE